MGGTLNAGISFRDTALEGRNTARTDMSLCPKMSVFGHSDSDCLKIPCFETGLIFVRTKRLF